jgi:hypothetical protein
VYYATRAGAAATDVVLQRVPVHGGAAVTVTSERLRNVIGLHGTMLYYSFERPLMDGDAWVATDRGRSVSAKVRLPCCRGVP